MAKKMFTVSLTLSVEAANEKEAMQVFSDRLSVQDWTFNSIEVEPEEII
jgi:hypothetical protein